MQQAIAVGEHHVIELAALGVIEAGAARFQCVQVQPNRGDRRLQLVRDGIHERVVLLVSLNLADEKCGVQDQAGDDRGEDEHAEEQQAYVAPVENDPADVQRNCSGDEAHTEGDEKSNRPAPADTLKPPSGFYTPKDSVDSARENKAAVSAA